MKIQILTVILSAFYMLKYASGTKIENGCKSWDCLSGIGGDATGTNRVCAVLSNQSSSDVFGVEACQPESFLCNVNVTLDTDNETCTGYDVWPWKDDMPAGDSCTKDQECYINKCNTTGSTKTCAGKAENETCADDRECYPGLYCGTEGSTRNCTPVAKAGENCSNTIPCEFGYGCANGTCTGFGTLDNGKKYYIQDDYLYPDPTALKNSMYLVCNDFYAYDSGELAEGKYPYLVCNEGLKKNFSSYERKVNDTMDCGYTLTYENGTTANFSEYAKCGYNHNSNYYCPKRRHPDEYSNELFRQTWSSLNGEVCHHRSTIQYCRGIEDNGISSAAFRSFMLSDFETTDDNYPKIAASERCSGNAITFTRNYWRMIDSAYGHVMTYFFMLFGFMTLAYLY